jgi:hypothetical protein
MFSRKWCAPPLRWGVNPEVTVIPSMTARLKEGNQPAHVCNGSSNWQSSAGDVAKVVLRIDDEQLFHGALLAVKTFLGT